MAKKKKSTCTSMSCGGCSGGFYGLGFLGAVIYYIAASSSFWGGDATVVYCNIILMD